MTQEQGFAALAWDDVLAETTEKRTDKGLYKMDGQTITLRDFERRNIGRGSKEHWVLEAVAVLDDGTTEKVRIPNRPAERIGKVIDARGGDTDGLTIRVLVEVTGRGPSFRAPAQDDNAPAPVRRLGRRAAHTDEQAPAEAAA